MRKFGLVAVLLAGVLAPATASGRQDMIDMLFEKMSEVYAEKGYQPTGWAHRGTLKQGEDEKLSVRLEGGTEYHVVGACDGKCSDFDIQLLDAAGKEVDRDDQEDDFPIVVSHASGNFTAHLLMSACEGTCSYGVRVFRK